MAALVVTNTTVAGDCGLLVDDFSISPAAAWMTSVWRGDATSGIYPELSNFSVF